MTGVVRFTVLVACVVALLCPLAAAGVPAGGQEVADRDRIPELKQGALDGLTDERVRAISALGAISDENRLTQFQVPDFLLGILNDTDNNSLVREAAVDALAKVIRYVPTFTDKALRPMVAILQAGRTESVSVRRRIAEAAAGFLDPGAVAHRSAFQALMRLATGRDEQPAIIAAAMVTLAQTGYSEALTVVLAGIRDNDEQIRAAALESLDALLAKVKIQKPDELVTQLVAIVSDENVPVEVRMRAMSALVATLRTGVEVARVAGPLVQVLDKACEAKEPRVAAAVVTALYRVPERNSVEALKKAYNTFLNTPGADGHEAVRVAVALTLGEYFHAFAKRNDFASGQEVSKALMEISRKEPLGFTKAARAAVFALGLMENRKYDRTTVVADLIVAMAQDKEPEVKNEARRSLIRLTGRDLGDDPKKWEEWFKKSKGELAPQG
jgi:HEAT repeat protein